MSKLFTIAGTSTLNGKNTYRFATGKLSVRVTKLKRHGHEDVALQELPEAMSKEAAVAFLTAQGTTATMPTVGRASTGKTAKVKAEKPAADPAADSAAADAAAKKAAFVERMKAARAAKRAAADANFIAGLTGDDAAEVGAAALLTEVEAEAEAAAEVTETAAAVEG